MKHAETALAKDQLFEAKRWTREALAVKPGNFEAQKLMAKILDQEIVRERALPTDKTPEEFTSKEKKLQIKTWLERSQEFLRLNQFDEALLAAEQVFQLDPGNSEASRLVDQIKGTARTQGRDESFFLQNLYDEEIQNRIQKYHQQAEEWMKAGRFGAARLALEKILILDPKDKKAQRLLLVLERKEEPL